MSFRKSGETWNEGITGCNLRNSNKWLMSGMKVHFLSFAEGAIIFFYIFSYMWVCMYLYMYLALSVLIVKLLGEGEKKTHHMTTTCNLPHSLTLCWQGANWKGTTVGDAVMITAKVSRYNGRSEAGSVSHFFFDEGS